MKKPKAGMKEGEKKEGKEKTKKEPGSRAGQSLVALIGGKYFREYLDPACTDQRAAMANYLSKKGDANKLGSVQLKQCRINRVIQVTAAEKKLDKDFQQITESNNQAYSYVECHRHFIFLASSNL
jgi:hypothetical protein